MSCRKRATTQRTSMERPYCDQMDASFVCSGMRLIFEVKEIFRAQSSTDLDVVSDSRKILRHQHCARVRLKVCLNAEGRGVRGEKIRKESSRWLRGLV